MDIESELAVIADCAPPGEEARGGERETLLLLVEIGATHLSILDRKLHSFEQIFINPRSFNNVTFLDMKTFF